MALRIGVDLGGTKIEGSCTKIEKAAKEVTLTREIAGKPYARVYPYNKIHAVTMGGKRYVLTAKSTSGSRSWTRSSVPSMVRA